MRNSQNRSLGFLRRLSSGHSSFASLTSRSFTRSASSSVEDSISELEFPAEGGDFDSIGHDLVSSQALKPHDVHCRGVVYDTQTETLYPMVTSENGEVRSRDGKSMTGHEGRYKIIQFDEGNRFIDSLSRKAVPLLL